MKIKTLSEEVKYHGFQYTLVKRTESKAIYRREGYGNYEVFIIKPKKPVSIFTTDTGYDMIERFPNNEAFGKTAWACSTLELAEKRYAILP
jgi:hypothetical protein